MIKKLSRINIPYFILLLALMIFSSIFSEYKMYFTYGAVVIMFVLLIFDLIKIRKEDKADGTDNFKLSLYNVLCTLVFIGILFYLINSNYPSRF